MRAQSLDILYEDRHLIVCVKPSGTATQSRNIKSADMVSLLKNHIAANPSPEAPAGTNSVPKTDARKKPPAKNASGEPYLAVIHRLDQPVQGIMVFAKTPFAAGELSKELQNSGFGKYYRALVSENPPKASGILEDYIVKDQRHNTSRICQKESAGAKFAKLSYQTVPDNAHYFRSAFTELDIHLHTGRHHQIRVQLSHIGCPIIGDTKYNTDHNTEKNGWQELKLCSYRLEFTHPKTKKPMRFSLI